MRNKNGFTLVEVLAVMIILGLLMILIIPAYSSIFSGIKRNTYHNKLIEIETAAKKYGNKIKDDVKDWTDDPIRPGCYKLEPSFLIEKGYLQSDMERKPALIDPSDNREMTGVIRLCYCKSSFDIEAFYEEEFDPANSYFEGDTVSDIDGNLYECVLDYSPGKKVSNQNDTITGSGLNKKTNGKAHFIKIDC